MPDNRRLRYLERLRLLSPAQCGAAVLFRDAWQTKSDSFKEAADYLRLMGGVEGRYPETLLELLVGRSKWRRWRMRP